MHELAGHTEPMIMNRQGNAISIENSIMEEIFICLAWKIIIIYVLIKSKEI